MALTTIRAFEHETLTVGRPVRAVDGSARKLTSSEFDALVLFNDRREQPAFTVGHRSVKFRQFVGYVQVGELGIEILPKADRGVAGADARGNWHEALLEMLRVSGRLRSPSWSAAMVSLRHSSLLEVFVATFLDEVEKLLHEGLARAYRSVEENGNCYSGRLVVREHIRANLVHAERFFVARQAYDLENVVNRILRTALAVLGFAGLSDSTRRRRDRVWASYPEVATGVFQQSDFDRLHLTRNTVRYERALELARLILLEYSPLLQAGPSNVFSLLFDMNQLWEAYICAVLRRAVPKGVVVDSQVSRSFWKAQGQSRHLRPDIILRAKGVREPLVIIDTKWKLPVQGRPADGDLKQMFAYNELFEASHSVLLYPSEHVGKVGVMGKFLDGVHSCETRYISIRPGQALTEHVMVQLGSWIPTLRGETSEAMSSSSA